MGDLFTKMDNSLYKFKPFIFETINYQDGQKVPKPRSGHRIVVTDSELYSFGGYNPTIDESDDELRADSEWLVTKPLFREMWKFSFITRQWTRLSISDRTPRELVSHCATLIDDKYMIIFGGTGFPFGVTSSNKLFVLNIVTNEWNLIETNCDNNQLPMEQYGQALAADKINNHLYVVGGTNGFQYSIDVHKFDLNSRLWHNLYQKNNVDYNEFPQERYRHEVIYYENKLFIVGGGQSNLCHSLVWVPVFDVKTRKWSQIQTKNDLNVLSAVSDGYPSPRRCHDCVLIDDSIFVMGGTDGPKTFDDLWKLDLNWFQWRLMSVTIPRALYFHSAAVSSTGRLSIFGGVTDPDHTQRTNQLFTAWLKIPALKEIAFEAVLHYINPNRNESISEILYDLKIPLNFRQRITQ